VTASGNFRTRERQFTRADVVRAADRAVARFRGDVSRAHAYAGGMADRYESHKWEQVMDLLRGRMIDASSGKVTR
jgi:hypothetical protein